MKAPLVNRCEICIRVWLYTRYWRCFLFGAPALVALLGSSTVAVFWLFFPTNYQARYVQLGIEALEKQNLQAANLYFRRLTEAHTNRPDYQLLLAVSYQKLGQTGLAAMLFRRLAPLDGEQGYVPAHLALADERLASNTPTKQQIQEAEQHLLMALRIEPENVDAHARLGELYFRLNRLEEARTHLLAAVTRREALALLLSRIPDEKSETTRGSWADRAVSYYRDVTTVYAKNAQARIRLAEATLARGGTREALEILKEGWKSDPLPAYRAPLAQAYVNVLVEAQSKDELSQLDRVRLLDEGLSHDPLHPYFLRMLYEWVRPSYKNAEAVARALQQAAAQESVEPSIQLLLAIKAIREQRGTTPAAD